jgi:serine/threonine protein kinase
MVDTALVQEVLGAKRPEDLFGPRGDPAGSKAHLRLAKALHPDSGGDKDLFAAMEALWTKWNRPENTFTLHTRRHTYEVTTSAWRGTVANLYHGTDEDDNPVLIKMVRDPRNNDLMEREAKALKALHPKDEPDRFYYFSPVLLETFKTREKATGKERRVNVIKPTAEDVLGTEGRWYSLEEVHQAYPTLSPRAAAWMWRRLLHFASRMHEVGVVHGAITPDNVLIHPEKHGLMLVGWTYSSVEGTPIPAIVKRWRDLYPPEVTERKVADTSTDIYMISKLMGWLMKDPPRGMRSFIRGCAIDVMALRPQEPAKLHRELDELLEQMWGKRTFTPFSMSGTKVSV